MNWTQRTLAALAAAVAAQTGWADVILTRTREVTGNIVRVEAGSIVVRLEAGEIRVPLAEVMRVNIAPPAGVAGALAGIDAGKSADAVGVLRPVVERYGGLPVPWVEEATLRLGDAYLGMKDDARARSSYENFAKLYPQSPAGPALVVKLARVQARQGKTAEALAATQQFLEPLLKKEPLTDAQKAAIAEALVIQGDCFAATSEPNRALDSYLLVVTLFDVTDAVTAEATLKAGQMFEQLKNPKRAQHLYEDLTRMFPQSELVKPAQERLAALAKSGAQ